MSEREGLGAGEFDRLSENITQVRKVPFQVSAEVMTPYDYFLIAAMNVIAIENKGRIIADKLFAEQSADLTNEMMKVRK